MYDDAQTWNPFKGCEFDCVYCKPSFQLQAKRQMHRCQECYNYTPHEHPERLKKIPSKKIIFVCGNGDLSFCDPNYTVQIVDAIRHHNKRCPHKIYYFQSKNPGYFDQFNPGIFPDNVIMLTTLETNRDAGYGAISKAPLPTERYKQFLNLELPRKVVTIEPAIDFDLDVFTSWIMNINPEYVWLGYNSKPNSVKLPEPLNKKFVAFATNLINAGIKIKYKNVRGMFVPKV
jgi:hypothetical protein